MTRINTQAVCFNDWVADKALDWLDNEPDRVPTNLELRGLCMLLEPTNCRTDESVWSNEHRAANKERIERLVRPELDGDGWFVIYDWVHQTVTCWVAS